MSGKQWKRVGDYPPPRDKMVMYRVVHRDNTYSRIFTATSGASLGRPDTQWCEIEIPDEVADPPVDKTLDAEAARLRETFWKVDSPKTFHAREPWASSRTKRAWRAVALEAREINGRFR